MKCGYIALVGRPNVGKSTLLNALVGAKLAGVSDKAQTTRNKIVGLWIQDETQMVFLDTPGMHDDSGRPLLNQMMMREAWKSLAEADQVLFLVDGKAGFLEQDETYLAEVVKRSRNGVRILVSKSDLVKKDQFDPLEQQLSAFLKNEEQASMFGKGFYSAKRPEDVSELRSLLAESLPAGPWLYDAEQLTDRSQKFICSEYIREQLFRLLGDELPYGSGVIVEHIDFNGAPIHVMADIYVERNTQKAIVIGKGGAKIKKIGQGARTSMENLFGDRVYLELFVKVKPGWVDKKNLIEEISHLIDE